MSNNQNSNNIIKNKYKTKKLRRNLSLCNYVKVDKDSKLYNYNNAINMKIIPSSNNYIEDEFYDKILMVDFIGEVINFNNIKKNYGTLSDTNRFTTSIFSVTYDDGLQKNIEVINGSSFFNMLVSACKK